MRRLTAVVLAAALLPLTVGAVRWDSIGHRVVAWIAWEHMNPVARREVIRLLESAPPRSGLVGLFPAGDADTIQRRKFHITSIWADTIRTSGQWNVYHRGTWHYVNRFWRALNGQPASVPGMSATGLAVRKTRSYSDSLRSSVPPDSLKARELAWLVHLVGDIHQPLHCSSRVTNAPGEQDGDSGGNEFRLTTQDYPNLHSYWDGILRRTFVQHANESSEAYLKKITEKIMADFPRTAVSQWLAVTSPAAWCQESLRLAQTEVYGSVTRGQFPNKAYRRHAYWRSASRIALADYRLADLLNRVFPPP